MWPGGEHADNTEGRPRQRGCSPSLPSRRLRSQRAHFSKRRRTPASTAPWSLMATTPLTPSTPSKVSRVFSTADRNDAAARSTTPRSSAHRLEGLVRDNRVEVRVLFGAPRKAPLGGAFRVLGLDLGGGGPLSLTTPSGNWATSVWPSAVAHHRRCQIP